MALSAIRITSNAVSPCSGHDATPMLMPKSTSAPFTKKGSAMRRLQNPHSDINRLLRVYARQCYHKLVSSVAHDPVLASNVGNKNPGHISKKAVSRFMSIRVIYFLEPVNICKYERTEALAIICSSKLSFQPAVQVAACYTSRVRGSVSASSVFSISSFWNAP